VSRVCIFLCLMLSCVCVHAATSVRLKDLGRFDGWRENYLVGFGVVTGLAGTGDSARSKATRQSIANLLSNFDITISSEQINSRNVAIVSVTASLPAVAHRGDRATVLVTSVGDARSLAGGTLLLAPLKGPDGKVYALAQGPVSIGGYRYDEFGNVAQKNHPTAGSIPGGAHIEVELSSDLIDGDGAVDFILNSADYTTVERVASAINARLGYDSALVKSSGAVRVRIPNSDANDVSRFLSRIESIQVQPDIFARVVVNERTGTIVSGGDVRISSVTIAHGDVKVSVTTDYSVSQPYPFASRSNGVRTAIVPNSRLEVDEAEAAVIEMSGRDTVADLVRSLHKVNASTRDIISVLQAIKAAGALHADLIIQ